ncbi:hypothetical protein [Anaerostipes sp.]|uniref:hypothetical protein n=1 Tax=Anaerostipes sp. TaxID=1872530 RepID=UPI0025C15A11|nr:hypothetical protein [Anaerostipes sp.]MBS7007382.1 hypothetical protein [Anaerostipes sp.]
MVRKGLLYETIIKTAVTLTEENGSDYFSLRNHLEIGQDESFDFMLEHFINSIKKEGEDSGRQSRRAL